MNGSRFLRIDTSEKILLQGRKTIISLQNMEPLFTTWKEFKTQLSSANMLKDRIFYSISNYGKELAEGTFSPFLQFERWSATPFLDGDKLLPGNELLELDSGLFAVFLHVGLHSDFPKTAQIIYHEWLPSSVYRLDARPHFEILDHRSKMNDPLSEEEIWIPICRNNG